MIFTPNPPPPTGKGVGGRGVNGGSTNGINRAWQGLLATVHLRLTKHEEKEKSTPITTRYYIPAICMITAIRCFGSLYLCVARSLLNIASLALLPSMKQSALIAFPCLHCRPPFIACHHLTLQLLKCVEEECPGATYPWVCSYSISQSMMMDLLFCSGVGGEEGADKGNL